MSILIVKKFSNLNIIIKKIKYPLSFPQSALAPFLAFSFLSQSSEKV
jgi:hypothetical protein